MADTDVAERARIRQNRRLALILPVYVLMGLVVGLIVFLILGVGAGDPGFAGWLILATVTLTPLIVAAMIVGGRLLGVRWLQPALIMGVERDQRKKIRAAVRADRPVAPEYVPIASDLARRMQTPRRVIRWNPAVAVFLILSRFFSDDFDALDGVIIATALFILGSLPFVLRDTRKARRWLADHGDSPMS